jgi:hypothetical protein
MTFVLELLGDSAPHCVVCAAELFDEDDDVCPKCWPVVHPSPVRKHTA